MSNILWEGVKATAGIVGQAALETGKKGKLQTELILLNREMDSRKRAFGVDLYDYVEPLSQSPHFYAANDKMTDTLRGPLLTAQREVRALGIKRTKLLLKIGENENQEKTAYVTATSALERLQNAAIKTGFVSHHAKLKAELAMVETQIKDFKQLFGLEMYQILVDLEDIEGWLPTVRDIRSIYDQARKDVEAVDRRRLEKEKEIIKLGGIPMTTSSERTRRKEGDDDEIATPTSRYFKQALAAETEASNGGGFAPPPVSAPLPSFSYGATNPSQQPFGMAATTQTPPPHDPFGMGTPATTQQTYGGTASHDPFRRTADPFATVAPAPSSYENHGQWMDMSDRSFGSTPVLGAGGDPFGNSGNDLLGNLSRPPAADDPFAAFDALQANNTATTNNLPPSQTNFNPLFRY